MNIVTRFAGLIYLGLDVHKDTITVAALPAEAETPTVDKIAHDEEMVRRLVNRFPDRSVLRCCYEAGPTGFELQRLLTALGVSCEVVAPSLIPRAPGDRVKTDRRDSVRLVRLYRAGELVAIHVPSPAEEAVRDLCRARVDMVIDRSRARHRLSKFLLRHGRVYRDGAAWTGRHDQWLGAQRFTERAMQCTYDHYRAVLVARDAELGAVAAELAGWVDSGPFAEAVSRLAAYRGVAEIGALTVASEVVDWRRFPRARSFMGFTGLTASEYSSGARTHRGRITKAGPTHLRSQLVESAWAYRHRPTLSVALRRRQQHADADTVARSWACQQRLCGRVRRMSAARKQPTVITVAVARELAGFLWAEMTA